MADSDEFAEFDTDEASFDAMMREAEPAELTDRRQLVTVRSLANDAVTFAVGLQVSVGNATATGSAPEQLHESAQRLPPVRRQEVVAS